jgi:dihydrodipicolinate synthase/N-acetylneuraminate lyase
LQCFSILQQTYSRRNQHFKVSQASPIPIIIYNVQEELQVYAAKTVRLANDFQNIVAVKAAGDMVQAMQIVRISQKIFL